MKPYMNPARIEARSLARIEQRKRAAIYRQRINDEAAFNAMRFAFTEGWIDRRGAVVRI